MFEFILECHLLMLFLILLRALFGSFLSAKNALCLVAIYSASFFTVWVVIRGRKADYFGKSDWENTSYAATGFLCPV